MKIENKSNKMNPKMFERVRENLAQKSVRFFEYLWALVWWLVFTAVVLTCFIYFSYKGIKYVYTFTTQEISEYNQKKEDLINEKIEIEARKAISTYNELGLAGLVELSKTRYEHLNTSEYSLSDLYGAATIDIIGEILDRIFLEGLADIDEQAESKNTVASSNNALRSDYFEKTLTDARIRSVHNRAKVKKYPDCETMRFYIQRVVNKVFSEQLGNDNQLTDVTAKNIIEVTLFFSSDFTKSFGLTGLQKYSQMCYRELERSKVISLRQVEKCFIVDVYGFTYIKLNKMLRNSLTEYFSIESTKNRPSAFLNRLGISEIDSQKYRQAWLKEFLIQSKTYFKNEDGE